MNVGEERTASHSPKDESKWDHYSQLSPEELDCARSKYPNIQPAGRRLLEYGAEKEGKCSFYGASYAADTADVKYGATHTIVWLFDQSSCHKTYDDLALQSNKILVRDGGPQRLRDTVWGETTGHDQRGWVS